MRALACALLLALGCGEPPRSMFVARVRVESDPGVVLAGASVLRDGVAVATTDATGAATLAFAGISGESTDLRVQCPVGFESPASVAVRMHPAVDGRAPEYAFACAPRVRNVVVAVRATHADLPLVHLGRPIGKTDAFGVVHALIAARPGETVDVMLDTSERPRLKPQNPSARWIVKPQEDAVVFEQKFEEEKAPRAVVRRPSLPTRIPGPK